MKGRFSGCGGRAFLGAVMAASAFLTPAFAQDSRQKPAPAPATAGTNVVRVDRLQRLEDELTRFLKDLWHGNSVEGVMTPRSIRPAVRVVTPRRKDREEKNDWTRMDPNEFANSQGSEDLRKLFQDSKDFSDKDLSPREQFLKDFLRDDTASRSLMDERSGSTIFGKRESNDKNAKDSQTPLAVLRSEENLRNLLQEQKTEAFSDFSRRRSFDDILGGPQPEVMDFVRHENKYAEEYRKQLAPQTFVRNDPASVAFGKAMNTPMLAPSTAPLAPTIPEPSLAPKTDLLGPQFGSINPVLTPSKPLDVTATVLNQWNPLYTPSTTIEPPRTTYSLPKPNFEAPRRKF